MEWFGIVVEFLQMSAFAFADSIPWYGSFIQAVGSFFLFQFTQKVIERRGRGREEIKNREREIRSQRHTRDAPKSHVNRCAPLPCGQRLGE